MSSEVLYRKWRPQTLGEVVGQEAVTTTLLNAVRTDRVGHAYLFCGPRGTGKTSTGRILAKAVNCLDPRGAEPCNACEACVSISEGRCLDVIEIDAASNRGVDDIRQLRERVHYASGTVRRKVYIVDEVHMLTDAASNALLKTLEEPPPHVMFILATTEFHKVLPTIVSRCQSFHFRRLTLNAIGDKLRMVCEREGVEAEDETLVAVSRAAGGSLRDAENILQQLIASRGRELHLDDVRATLGIGDEAFVLKLIASLVARDLAGGLRVLHAMSDQGADIRNFGRQVVAALRDVMLVQSGCEDIVDGGAERVRELRQAAAGASTMSMATAARRFSEMTARDVSQPLLALELAYVDCVVGREDESAGTPRRAEAESPKRTEPRPARASEPARGQSHPRSQGRPAPARTVEPPTVALSAEVQALPPVSHDADSPVTGGAAPAGDVVDASARTSGAPPLAQPEPGESQPDAAPPEQVVGELGRVRASWKEYVDSLRGLGSTGNLDAFLRSACEPVSLEDDVLVLRFAYEFHKSKVEDPKYRHVVEERLQEFFGRPFRVSCVLDDSADASAAAPQSLPAPAARPERLVDAALRLGARPRRQG